MHIGKQDVDRINKQLIDRFGKELDGRAKWRIAFTEHLKEVRKGIFDIVTPAGIYLRTEGTEKFPATREQPKYMYIKDRWVLEELAFIYNPEIIDSEKGTYEHRWTFEDPVTKDFQIPLFKAAEFIVVAILTNREELNRKPKKSEAEHWLEDALQMDKDIAKNYEELGGKPGIAEALNVSEGVVVPRNFEQTRD